MSGTPPSTSPSTEPALGDRAIRNVALVLGARTGSRLVALVTWIAVANFLGDARFGQVQTLLSYVTIVLVLTDFGLASVFTLDAARRPRDLERYLSAALSLKAGLTLLGLVMLVLLLNIPDLGALALPGAAFLVSSGYSSLLRSTFYIRGQLRHEAVAILLEALVVMSLVLTGVLLRLDIGFFVWALVVGTACGGVYSAVALARLQLLRLAWTFDASFLSGWVLAGLPFAISFVLSHVYWKIDVPLLQFFRSYREVGWYAFAYKPFEALLFIPAAIVQVAFPIMALQFQDPRQRFIEGYQHLYRALLAIGYPLTIGTALLAHGIVQTLHLYPQSEPALQILALGIVFMFVNNAFVAALNVSGGQTLLVGGMAAILGLNVAMNLLLIPPLGYLGAAWATVVSEFGLALVGWYLLGRQSHRLGWFGLSWRILLAGVPLFAVLWPFRAATGWHLVAATLLGSAVYLAGVLALQAISREELSIVARALRRR